MIGVVVPQPFHRLGELLEDHRRETERRLVEDQQLRLHHQRAGDREHLLFAAGQRFGDLGLAFFEDGKQLEEPGELRFARGGRQVLAAEIEVLAHRHVAEQLARLRALDDAAARDRSGRHAAQRAIAETDRPRVRHEAGDGVEERRLAGTVEADDRHELSLANVDRDVVERLRLVVEDAHAVDAEQDGLGVYGVAPLDRLDLAAEVDAPHRFVAHHLVRGPFGDVLAEIHGQNAVDQRRYALDVVVDEQHGSALVAQRADEVGERAHLAAGEPGERLVDQHDLGIAGDRFGHLHATQVGERERRRMPVHDRAEADQVGDLSRAFVDAGRRDQPQQRVR